MNRLPATLSTPTLAWLRVLLALFVIDHHYSIYDALYNHVASHFGNHLPLLEACGSGNIAVGGFFIISGYLVAQILQYKYKENSAQGFLHFVISRSIRLYPLYIIVLTGFIILKSLFIFSSHQQPDNLHLFLNYAVFYYGFQGFFQTHTAWDNLIIGPSWTLALDFIFYPIGAILFRSKPALLITAGLLIGYYLVIFYFHNMDFASIHLGVVNQAWWRNEFYSTAEPNLLAFLLGMIAQQYAKPLHLPTGTPVILISVFIIMYCAYFPVGLTYFSGQLISFIAFVFLVHALAKNGFHPFETLLSNWTFAVYLVHIPILEISRRIFKNSHHAFLITTVVAIVISSITALILAHYIEGQFIEKRRKAWLNSWHPTHHTAINYSLLSIPVLSLVLASLIFYSRLFIH